MDDKKKKKVEQNEESDGEVLNSLQGEQVQDDKSKEDESVRQTQDALLQQLEEVDQKYKRALADYQNVVRRTQEEKREWAKLSNKELILKLLPILDTLMLAEKHTKDQNFTLAVQQFLQVLKEEGIERIKTVGEMFDPLVMEAVETREGQEHKVLEEMKAGFRAGDVILRPALVVVGKKAMSS